MHEAFKQMPAPIISLVEQIEEAAGNAIELEHNSGRTAAALQNPPLILYTGRFDESSPVYPDRHGVMAHEIMHHARWFVDRVPFVYTTILRRPDGGVLTEADLAPGDEWTKIHLLRVDDCFEHIVIENRLRGLGFRVDYVPTYRAFWMDPPGYADVRDRWNLLMAYLMTQFVACNPGLTNRAQNHLRSVRLLDDARKLEVVFSRLLASPDPVKAKIGMCIAFFTALGIPPADLRIAAAPRKSVHSVLQPMPKRVAVPLADGRTLELGTGFEWERVH